MDRTKTQTSPAPVAGKRPAPRPDVAREHPRARAADKSPRTLQVAIAAFGEAGVEISTHGYFDSEAEAARDFLYRAPGDVAASRFVLCEINVSSVSPFREAAVPAIAATVSETLKQRCG